MDWTKKRIAAAALGGFVVLGVIGSALPDPDTKTSGGASAATPAPAAVHTTTAAAAPVATPTPELSLALPSDRDVYRDRVVVSGRVSVDAGGSLQGASVKVDGKTAPVRAGRWTKTVTVSRGDNDIDVVATKPGYDEDSGTVTLTRKRSKAEIAAALAKARAAAAARKASYLASTTTIPYNQLEKNADRHAGERVTYRGQIFQIQEDGDDSIILLSVTDEGFDFWDDHIWVDYHGHIKGAEGDMLTVYGAITGTKSYDTQIGGTTYVPRMRAKYVAE
ncbi:MAG: hypothetical protein AAGC46_20945 [Solirubrobacteraceae bacterium]